MSHKTTFALFSVITLMSLSVASAGYPPFPRPFQSPLQQPFPGQLQSHRSPYHDSLDLVSLDAAADRLAQVLEHLHDDAYELSPQYQHTAAIVRYVSRAEALQNHLHHLLHDALTRPTFNSRLRRYVESDIRDVADLVVRLDTELQHQGYDGACPLDYQHIVHMRGIIQNEAYPLIDQMNSLIGAPRCQRAIQARRIDPIYSVPTPVPTPGYDVGDYRRQSYRPAITIGAGGFRISWGR